MIERHYGNDVPTGPIPVVPPPDEPARGRTLPIPAPRSESTPRTVTEHDDRPKLSSSRRRSLPWILLVLAVLAVIVAVVLGQSGTPSSAPRPTQIPTIHTATPPTPLVPVGAAPQVGS